MNGSTLKDDKLKPKSINAQLQEKLEQKNVEIPNRPGDLEGGGYGVTDPFRPGGDPSEPPATDAPAGDPPQVTDPQSDAAAATQRGAAIIDAKKGKSDASSQAPPASAGAAEKPAGAPQAGADAARTDADTAGGTGDRAAASAAPAARVENGNAGDSAPALVDVEVEDPDTGRKWTVKAPATEAQAVKRGWLRQSDYTRKTQALGKYRPILEPLIEGGQMETLAPLIQLATQDEPFAVAVIEAYQRRINNQPLTWSDGQPQRGAAPAAVASAAPAAASAPVVDEKVFDQLLAADPNLDPYTVDALKKVIPAVVTPLAQQLQEVRGALTKQEQTAQQQAQQAQQQRALASQLQAIVTQTRSAFVQQFPGEFTGTDADFTKMNQLYQYGLRAGFITGPHDLQNGLYRAKFELDQETLRNQPAPTGSAAAATLDQIEAEGRRLASQAAGDVGAATTGVKTAAGGAAAPPAKLQIRGKNGERRPMKNLLADALRITEQRAQS